MNLKHYFLVAICMICSSGYLSSQVVFKNSEVKISKLEAQVWVMETFDSTCMYIVEGTKKAMLIDTGTKCAHLDSIVGLITKKPLYVVLTHAHGDHAGNVKYFKDIYMHPADTVLFNRSAYKGNLHYLKDGDVFDLGERTIEVSYMPAHTPGSIVLLDKKSGSCFSGDAFGSNQVWLQLKPGAPISTYISSCIKMEKLLDNGITKIYCGHYCYVKKAFDKSYILSMHKLAEGLKNGTAPAGKSYPKKYGCKNPMIISEGEASIVYDPDHIN